jgi:uncharacterized protein YjbI with pentapeptide repeats
MVAAPSVLLTWYWRDKKRREDHLLASESGIAKRYTEATRLLAHRDPMVRVNGLFSLWDLARESPNHRLTVSRTLAAFVRERSQWLPSPLTERNFNRRADVVPAPVADVQTAASLVADELWTSVAWVEEKGSARQLESASGQVDLREARLTRVDLAHARLEWAHLNGAELDLANLIGAKLAFANLTCANLEKAMLDGADLSCADLSMTTLRRASLRGADLSHAILTSALLSRANLENANLEEALLDQADLSTANLESANLRDASLEAANLREANLASADLRGSDFKASNLAGASLATANVDGAKFGDAQYDERTQFPPGFDPVGHGMKKCDPPVQIEPTI